MAVDLLKRCLVLTPSERITAKEALKHKYFAMQPYPCRREDLPKFDLDIHEYQVKMQKSRKINNEIFKRENQVSDNTKVQALNKLLGKRMLPEHDEDVHKIKI